MPILELPHSTSRPTAGILILVEGAVGSSATHPVTDGLPAGSLLFADARLVAGGTPLTLPFFGEAMVRAAGRHQADVLLARHGAYPELLDTTLWDIAVRLGGDQIQLFTDFVLFTDLDGSVWLVPARTGPYVRLASNGLTLEMDPPFVTWSQRCEGVCRAAKHIIAATRPHMVG